LLTVKFSVAVTLNISFFYLSIALHRQQSEKEKQNINFAAPWKNFCARPWLAGYNVLTPYRGLM